MATENEHPDVLLEAALTPDVVGPAVLVWWRKVPIGFIRPLNRVPRLRPGTPAAVRKAHNSHFKPHIGKWYATMTDVGFHETKEQAARRLIETAISRPLPPDATGLLAAAIRNDTAEVDRLMAELKAAVQSGLAEAQPTTAAQRATLRGRSFPE